MSSTAVLEALSSVAQREFDLRRILAGLVVTWLRGQESSQNSCGRIEGCLSNVTARVKHQ